MSEQKIIVRIGEGVTHIVALAMVSEVMDMGRISDFGTAYCFVTKFSGNYTVVAIKNKTSDAFIVRKILPEEKGTN